jgi:hypothetical protein
MKRICAWCNRALDAADQPTSLAATHGVCPECRRRFFPTGAEREAGAAAAAHEESESRLWDKVVVPERESSRDPDHGVTGRPAGG